MDGDQFNEDAMSDYQPSDSGNTLYSLVARKPTDLDVQARRYYENDGKQSDRIRPPNKT